jgi:ribonuclease HI
MLVAEQFDNDSPSSSGSSSSLCWKKVWKLQVPPKVRAFWWRVIKGFVQCRQTLKLRHMEQIGFCKTCGADEETTFHALFECTWARRFWEGLHKAIGVKLPVLHRTSWATDLIDGKFLTEEQACYILCGAWAVWSERNAIWHGEGGRSVQQSVRWATETTFDLREAGRPKIQKPVVERGRWKPPDSGFIKINVDAGYNADQKNGSVGVVVRNHEGMLLRATALWFAHAASALILEAEAVRAGIRLAIDMGIQRVIIETDALEVVNLWKEKGTGRSIITSICQEVRELSGFLASFELNHVKRHANEAAHICSHRASPDRRRCLWINFTPPFLASILAKDCNTAI